jgi:hypothetical protein
MSRPQRIEYENAFYHVMNRGMERHTIFHGDEYYLCFLETLARINGVRDLGIPTNNRGPRHSALIPLYFLKNKGLYGSEMGRENEQP